MEGGINKQQYPVHGFKKLMKYIEFWEILPPGLLGSKKNKYGLGGWKEGSKENSTLSMAYSVDIAALICSAICEFVLSLAVFLTVLEAAASRVLELSKSSPAVIGLEDVGASLESALVRYDRDGDQHYDTISAFIKSVRGNLFSSETIEIMVAIDLETILFTKDEKAFQFVCQSN